MKRAVIAVLLMAFVTYIPRVLPVAIFRKQIKSRYIKSFLNYVPFAVLGSLTFPDIFYSTGTSPGHFITALSGTAAALFLAFKEKSLVVVAFGAIIAVCLTSILF